MDVEKEIYLFYRSFVRFSLSTEEQKSFFSVLVSIYRDWNKVFMECRTCCQKKWWIEFPYRYVVEETRANDEDYPFLDILRNIIKENPDISGIEIISQDNHQHLNIFRE